MARLISHIGIAVHNIESAISHWEENLGFRLVHRIDVQVEGMRTAFLSPDPTHGGTAVELISPLDPEDPANIVAKFLAAKGEGVFHFCLIVDDLLAESQALAVKGMGPVMRPPAALGAALVDHVRAESNRYILPPKRAHGVLVELVQAKN